MRILILFIFIASSAFAQTAREEINNQVWKPFIKGFTEGNTDLFMGVHSKDLTRASRDANEIINWSQYYAQMKEGNDKRKSGGARLEIELHFTERINNDNQAIEVGVYKTTFVSANGKRLPGYGRFHVVHRKENGTWKILVDTDSSEGGTIGEAQFLAAKPME